ncbi:MAG: SLBB domain-containing protein [Opitutales bacterium]|nr:SLBB domain-containing protein [Opitutales bacterium]
MNLFKRFTFCGTLVLAPLVLLTVGCGHRPAEPSLAPTQEAFTYIPEERRVINSEWLSPSNDPYTLGPGDLIEIEVIGEPTTLSLAPVGPDGKIYFYGLPGMDVWGMTPSEVRVQLESELATYFRGEPRVSVVPREIVSRKVWLLGRFNEPGVYPLEGPTTLLEAIANAGGPEASTVMALGSESTSGTDEAADLRRAFVIRDGEVLPVDIHRLLLYGDMSQNIYLESGDLVHLPTAGATEIYVLGGVFEPRAVAYTGQTSLLAAISAAGGPTNEAHLSQVAVLRGGTGEPRMVIFDFNKIILGDMSDVLLEPHDIVYVPLAPQRHLTRYLDIILSSFGRTVGINAGSRVLPLDADTTTRIFIPIETLP